MTQNNFNKMLGQTLGFEGGFVLDPAGGATNYGITQKTLDGYRKGKKLPLKNVKDLNTEDVINLYRDEFYNRPKINKLPSSIAPIIFDYGVNSGTSKAISALQSIVGTKADGIIGKNTLAKVNEYIKKNGDNKLKEALISQREEFLKSLVEQNPDLNLQFAKGWQNRINKLRKIHLSSN